jgi:hypothetical protein
MNEISREEMIEQIKASTDYITAARTSDGIISIGVDGNAATVLEMLKAAEIVAITKLLKQAGEQEAIRAAEYVTNGIVDAVKKAAKESEGG